MADTVFAFGDPRTQIKWSPELFKYALQDMFWQAMGGLGVNPTDIIVVNKDLTVTPGGSVRFELYPALTGIGGGDDATYTNNEQQIKAYNFSVPVHQRGTSTKLAGLASEQRTATKFREKSRELLSVWSAERQENDITAAACGLYNEGPAVETVNELYPSTNRMWRGGQTITSTPAINANSAFADSSAGSAFITDALLSAATATDVLFGTIVLNRLRRAAMFASPKLRPIRVKGKDYLLCLLHPYQVAAMQSAVGETGWAAIVAAAQVRGDDNPLFAGALGVFNHIILYEYDRLPIRTGAGGSTPSEGFALASGKLTTSDPVATGKTVARGVLMGAQAIAFAWAKLPSWIEGATDGDTKSMITTEMLYGVSRTRFSTAASVAQSDLGIINFDTCVVVDS